MNPRQVYPSAIALLVLCAIAGGVRTRAGEVEITVRDKKSGQPVPCRIHVKDAAGTPQRAGDLPFWFDHFVSPGTVKLQLTPSKYTDRISKISAEFFLRWERERIARIKIDDPGRREDVLAYHRLAECFWRERVGRANVK